MPTQKTAPLSSSPVAIFDFDGTIADSLELVLSEYNRLAPRFRAKPIDRDDLPRVRRMKADLIRDALRSAKGHHRRAAEALGLNPTYLSRLIGSLGIREE